MDVSKFIAITIQSIYQTAPEVCLNVNRLIKIRGANTPVRLWPRYSNEGEWWAEQGFQNSKEIYGCSVLKG